MATVNMATGVNELHPTRSGNTALPYTVEVDLDLADAVTAKGSALAAADVIQLIDVPVGTVILSAGFEVLTAAAGGSADVAVTLGTGADADAFVTTFDLDAAVAGAYAPAATTVPVVVGATADTIDLTISAATTAPTSGVLRVWAVLLDVSDRKSGGIVALGS